MRKLLNLVPEQEYWTSIVLVLATSKSIVLTQHEEGGGQVDADEGHADVGEEPEGGGAREPGAQDADEPEERLAAHAVAHRHGDDAEDEHDGDRHAEVRDDGVGVGLQLRLEGLGGEERHVDCLHLKLHESVLDGLFEIVGTARKMVH